jgi:hypothetical protein
LASQTSLTSQFQRHHRQYSQPYIKTLLASVKSMQL